MDDIWNPDRLANVGHVLSNYATHLAVGDRIRAGMEGDPCTLYRGVEDAPTGTVTEIQRDPSGYVRLRATMHDSGASVEFDNRNVSPDKIWEVDPSYVDTFRGRLAEPTYGHAEAALTEAAPEEAAPEEADAEPHEVHGNSDAAEAAIGRLQDDVAHMRSEFTQLKEDLVGLQREARDLFRGLRGTQSVVAQSLEGMASDIARPDDKTPFSDTLLDRYEMAQQADDRPPEAVEQDDSIYDVFRGPRASILASEVSDEENVRR